jgi:hypothetical protein
MPKAAGVYEKLESGFLLRKIERGREGGSVRERECVCHRGREREREREALFGEMF